MLERVEWLPLLSVRLAADVLVLVDAVGGEAAPAHRAGRARAPPRRRRGRRGRPLCRARAAARPRAV